MILDEDKVPPPAYESVGSGLLRAGRRTSPSHDSSSVFPLDALPSHLILEIIFAAIPPVRSRDVHLERRKAMYWLVNSFRLVSKAAYVASMHVLRSEYLPSYNRLVKQPYTSNPFPFSAQSSQQFSTTSSLQRETSVLDLYIVLKAREDLWQDESTLHIERECAVKDIFNFMQPRSRLEDLVREYGVRCGIVISPSAIKQDRDIRRHSNAVSFSLLSAGFTSRRATLLLRSRTAKQQIAATNIERGESLESIAIRLVKELGRAIRN